MCHDYYDITSYKSRNNILMLAKEQIIEFKQIWKEEFGEEISEDDAYEKGSNLVELMRMIRSVKIEEKDLKTS